MSMNQLRILCALAVYLCSTLINAQNTEKLYLSGTGLGDTRTWDFYCSTGMNSGKWCKIEVPSQWEQQGFGEYTYGRFYLNKEAQPSRENGLYRYKFKVPAEWKDKQVSIVFEGVMTDTEVKINGVSAGAIHQGGFYTFSYNITDKLKFGKKNELEVQVWKESSNKSVNAAERRADWWLFGGIYRPVYLKAVPAAHIKRIAVNATADGTLTTRLYTQSNTPGYTVALSLAPVGSQQTASKQIMPLNADSVQTLTTFWQGVRPWECEHPNLYTLTLELLNPQKQVVHIHEERIGFRTIEFRPQDGFYVNGTKVIMKGVNRHCFHPDGGRTTNKQLSLQDALLIKEMNMNAVRSHYPPDKHFLDVCDSLGLFYLDEFTGWHGRYDDEVGIKLLREMITTDANHPCIFLWSNGNEGGWNKKLDKYFSEFDLQQRHVVHAWADFNGVDTHHYPAYQTGTGRLTNGYKVFMPTEFLHARYDQGAGSGLEDFWSNYRSNPLFAGGFIWAFADEAVKRYDKNGILDSDGSNGPDGILGPYREKEGSFYTIREVWAPIQFKPLRITSSFKGEFLLSNDYLFSNLKECSMTYHTYSTPSPLKGGKCILLDSGKVDLPAIDPGETGRARMKLPARFFEGDVLKLEAYDRNGKSICIWTWPIKYTAAYFAQQQPAISASKAPVIENTDQHVMLSANGITAIFDTANGTLKEIRRNGQIIPFGNGPLPVGMKADLKAITTRTDGNDALLIVKYTGALDTIIWRMTPDGLLGMDALMLNRGNGGGYKGEFFDKKIYQLGLTFSYPEKEAKGMRWLGRGPYRVWKNRIPGTTYGVWHKSYNNTITGENFKNLTYPEFKGYHANLYWATIESDNSPFTVYSETDGIYLRVFTPQQPGQKTSEKDSMHPFPMGDISFLYDIPAMRSFKTISEHGPKSQPSSIRIKSGDDGLRMKLWFDFRVM